MKKKMFLLTIPLAIFCRTSKAQNLGMGNVVSASMANSEIGNYSMANAANAVYPGIANYTQSNPQPPGRDPVTNATPGYQEFDLKVNGLMNVAASSYVAVFNVVQVGLTAKSTDSIMSNTIEEFKRNLEKINIDTSAFKTDMISFVPKYGYESDKKIFSKKYNEVPEGFMLEKNIYVRFKKSSALDGILTAAAATEIYDLVKVDYFVPNSQILIDSLRIRCLSELKSRAKSYDMIGFKLDSLKKVMADNFATIYPETRYYSYSAYSRPSFVSLKKKATDQPYVNEYSKPVSTYYSQVNYDNYDVVINPEITEPVMQLSYTIAVKYFWKSDKQTTIEKKTYYIINKDGEVKPVPLE